MKTLISLMLIVAIFSGYRFTTTSIEEEINVPASTLDISESSVDLKTLAQIGEYDSIFLKPLFDEDREPEKKVVAKKKLIKPVRKKLSIQALGIALAGEKFLAVVKDLRNGKVLRLRVDEKIHGWTLTGVSANSLIFAQGDLKEIKQFRKDGG